MPANLDQAREATVRFVLRDRIGFLRTMVQYLPPVIRKKYLEVIAEIEELTK